nr:helix-turn-helix domain-containing protein [uncultured Flavobacterium sp.]
MAANIITTEDLNAFKLELLEEIKKILQPLEVKHEKKWLKSNEVRKLLNISAGTLQNLRVNGSISYTKIGGTLYYSMTDLDQLFRSNKVSSSEPLFNPKWLVR